MDASPLQISHHRGVCAVVLCAEYGDLEDPLANYTASENASSRSPLQLRRDRPHRF